MRGCGILRKTFAAMKRGEPVKHLGVHSNVNNRIIHVIWISLKDSEHRPFVEIITSPIYRTHAPLQTRLETARVSEVGAVSCANDDGDDDGGA